MNRLRAPAVQQVIEALQAGRSGPRDALQMMKLGDARQLFLDRIVRGPVRHARFGERHGDVNVVRDERLWLAGLARGVLGPHSHFRAPATRIARGENKFARNAANCRSGHGRRIFSCSPPRKSARLQAGKK